MEVKGGWNRQVVHRGGKDGVSRPVVWHGGYARVTWYGTHSGVCMHGVHGVMYAWCSGVWVWDVLWVAMGKDAHMVCRGVGMAMGTWMRYG